MAEIFLLNDHVRELFKSSKKLSTDANEAKKFGDSWGNKQLLEQSSESKKKMRHIASTMGKVYRLGGYNFG